MSRLGRAARDRPAVVRAAPILGVLVSAAVLWSADAAAQQVVGAQSSKHENEWLLVFIGMANLPENASPQLGRAIRRAKAQLADRARAAGARFAAIGVSLDPEVRAGLAYLLEGRNPYHPHDFGSWDEVHAGRGWLNTLAVSYIWRDRRADIPGVPQLLLIERTIDTESIGRIVLGADSVVQRLVGARAIIEWVNDGLPAGSR